MRVIYNIAIIKVRALMFILKYFNSKIRSFNNERKNVLKNLKIVSKKLHIYLRVIIFFYLIGVTYYFFEEISFSKIS